MEQQQQVRFDSCKVLVGCGTSDLSTFGCKRRPRDEHRHFSSGDQSHESKCPNLDFRVSDCTKLREQFDVGAFDVVVDKGTLDTLLFRTPKDAHNDLIAEYEKGVAAVAKRSALFVIAHASRCANFSAGMDLGAPKGECRRQPPRWRRGAQKAYLHI